MSDPAGFGSRSKPDNSREITLSASQIEETGMTVYRFRDWTSTWVIISVWHSLCWTEMTELVSFRMKFCIVMHHFLKWKNAVMFYIIVIWIWILPQIQPYPDPNQIQIHWIWPDPDPSRIHQIHRISGRIRIWIRCTPTKYAYLFVLARLFPNIKIQMSLERKQTPFNVVERSIWGPGPTHVRSRIFSGAIDHLSVNDLPEATVTTELETGWSATRMVYWIKHWATYTTISVDFLINIHEHITMPESHY